MTNQLELLAGAAFELAGAAGRVGDVAERSRRLGVRLVEGRFHVSVLGEFKRGKSTLVNALLGEEVLPTGVLPLTAVATEVSFGERGAVVVHQDGSRQEVASDVIAEFVTEERNPENEKQVVRVEVRLPAPLLEPGLVLVDTPGLGSIYRHNDEEARRALFDADGAILVLSADSPMSAQELELLGVLAERSGPTFFVLNKIDHLTKDETDEVRRFATDVIAAALGRKERLWCLSARAPLAGRRSGSLRGAALLADGFPDGDEFAAFGAAFAEFVTNELVEVRLATARNELSRLARALDDVVSLEEAALSFDAKELALRVGEFEATAADQRRAFSDERTLLARDLAALVTELSEHLFAFARTAPGRWTDHLENVARSAPFGGLEQQLQQGVEEAVREGFEEFRQEEGDRVEQAWSMLAEGCRARTEARVNQVKAAAADLFTVSLPDVALPEVSQERERFYYLFLHVDPLGEQLLRVARWLLPSRFRCRRLLARARAQLFQEFDKHAGRARWDLSQRLESVCRAFEVAMSEELEDVIEAITAGANRAEELRGTSETEHDRYLARSRAAREAARRALSLAETPSGG
jgi:small GTP-binding protein